MRYKGTFCWTGCEDHAAIVLSMLAVVIPEPANIRVPFVKLPTFHRLKSWLKVDEFRNSPLASDKLFVFQYDTHTLEFPNTVFENVCLAICTLLRSHRFRFGSLIVAFTNICPKFVTADGMPAGTETLTEFFNIPAKEVSELRDPKLSIVVRYWIPVIEFAESTPGPNELIPLLLICTINVPEEEYRCKYSVGVEDRGTMFNDTSPQSIVAFPDPPK